MKKHKSKLLLLLIPFVVISFGFAELSFKNTIFTQSRGFCCQLGECKYITPSWCHSTSTFTLFEEYGDPPKCTSEYTMTCYDCVNYSAAGEICPISVHNSCKKRDGSCYGWCYTPGIGWGWILEK